MAVFVTIMLALIVIPLLALTALFRALHLHVAGWEGQLLSETVALGGALGATAVMARIERRSVWSYGLRDGQLGRRVAAGALCGIALMSLEMALLFATGHLRVQPAVTALGPAIGFLALWTYVFAATGVFEEVAFRGYMLVTLARTRLGFWGAAVLLAVVFGAVHGVNGGEALVGEVAAGLFGLALAFAIRVTGSLWWAIGLHAGWDWTESYVWGVPDSGQVVPGTFLNAQLSGPHWLSGGTVGPEASVFVLIPLALIPLLAWRERSAVAA
ncbi:MAG: CPBP family intramembrane metalloprotease [Candidatus Eremiobacteraeota bacterium]|nr:CPBP family intramembrane metalloprotease [Candidatus Eremiobacteraeota bacterium]